MRRVAPICRNPAPPPFLLAVRGTEEENGHD